MIVVGTAPFTDDNANTFRSNRRRPGGAAPWTEAYVHIRALGGELKVIADSGVSWRRVA